MTREDVKKLFPGATDEQITGLLNQNNSEIAREKAKIEKMKSDSEGLKTIEAENNSLQAKLDELEQGNLTEIEKANKALEVANNRIAELEKANRISQQRSEASLKFKISAEQAKQVISDDGAFDMDILGQIIADKESASALAKEQEIAKMSANPNGHGGNGNIDSESIAVQLVKKNFGENKAQGNILTHYMNGGN
jgi:hypothetical protein